MFLRGLNDEQKVFVLGLANDAALADGLFDISEKKLIDGFKTEMGIEVDYEVDMPMDDICKELLKISSRKELIEITFEILGIMKGDLDYAVKEKNFMLTMCDIFGISESVLAEMEESIDDYYAAYKRIEKITEM